MTIHHATAKKAASLEITLVEKQRENGDTIVVATSRKPKFVMASHDPKVALIAVVLGRLFKAEYPALILSQISNGNFLVESNDDNDEGHILWDDERLPTLAEILDAAQDAGIDPEAGFREDHKVVVPEKYKQLYAERGNRDNCGDWLAMILGNMFVSKAKIGGKSVDTFDHQAFSTFLILNGVDMTGKWAGLPTSGQNGWVGRYRMNGRQKLELVIAKRGTLIEDADHTVTPPEDFLELMLEKHPNVDADWLD